MEDLDDSVVRALVRDEKNRYWKLFGHLSPVAAGDGFGHVITSGAFEVSKMQEENENQNKTIQRFGRQGLYVTMPSVSRGPL